MIDPELEAWVWSDSPHVAQSLGWSDMLVLRNWLVERGHWSKDQLKPFAPKRAYLDALRQQEIPVSNSHFVHIAENVSLRRCQDPSFIALSTLLRSWFPRPAGLVREGCAASVDDDAPATGYAQ